MTQYAGLLSASLILLGAGIVFYVASVAGLLWPQASSPTDVGVYAVTVTLAGLGAGGLMLRAAKINPGPQA